MSYKFSTGSVRKGDIYFEDDREGAPTYIDFGADTITLRPSGSAILYAEDDAVGIGTTDPQTTLHVKGDPGQFRVEDTTVDYAYTIDCDGDGIRTHFGDMTAPGDEDSFMTFGAYTGLNRLDTAARDFHLYGTNTTTGFYFDESAGTFGIGTATPDNLLTVVGGHISSDGGVRTGTQHFSWSARTANFADGTVDLVSYISFGNNSVWGWIEVTLTDNHIGAQTTGKYTKRYQIGRNVDTAIGHQAAEVPANIGSVVDEWNLGSFEVDSNDLRIPIHRLTTNQNSVSVLVEGQLHVAFLDTVDNVLNSLSLSTPAVVTNSATRDYYSIMSDRVGIGTGGPDRKLDVLDAADPQLRLTHTDGSNYVDFYANGAGDLEITGSGNNAHLRFISPQNATVVIQSQHTGDSDVSLAFSVDAGANVPFSMGVDDSDSDKFKIGAATIDTDTKVTVTTGGKVGIATTSPESYLSLGGSVQFKVNSVAGDTTLDDTYHVVAADCNSGNVTVTLPSVSESILGRQYIIKRADTGGSGGANSLTIARNGANIDGAASDLSSIGNATSHTLICLGGAGWIIVDKYVGI